MSKKKSNSIIAKDAEKVREFKPTLHMQKWLDTAVELQTDSPTEISAVAEQRRENWYDWLKVEGFEDWYYENYRKKRKRWLPTLDKIGLEQSKKGKYDFWKDMRKSAGEVEEENEPNIQVNVLNAIQKQREDYGI
jgi:hypothetical protein